MTARRVAVVATVLLCLGGGALLRAQNLVPNPGFEAMSSCPDNLSQMNRAPPWIQPTLATPDYFNSCSLAATGFCQPTPTVGIPDNCFGSEPARTGNGYGGGIFSGNQGNPEYREYMETPLSSPLLGGQTYIVSFWVSHADTSNYAIGSLGAYFSLGSVAPIMTTDTLTQFTPQVSNPNASFLTNTSGWVEVTGAFVATGDEDHLLIGNFLDSATCMTLPAATPVGRAIYYIDDVSVVEMAPACMATLCGDCNGDGVLNILDGLFAAQHASGLITLTGVDFTNCNVTGLLEPDPNAVVDVLDALAIAQLVAGLPVMLSCC